MKIYIDNTEVVFRKAGRAGTTDYVNGPDGNQLSVGFYPYTEGGTVGTKQTTGRFKFIAISDIQSGDIIKFTGRSGSSSRIVEFLTNGVVGANGDVSGGTFVGAYGLASTTYADEVEIVADGTYDTIIFNVNTGSSTSPYSYSLKIQRQ